MNAKEIIQALWARFRNLILYGIIGCCTASLDFLIFTGLTQWTSIHYIVANIFSCSTGILCSFLLNRKYNFKVTDHTARRMLIFFSVGIFGMLLSSVILHFCIDNLMWGELVSKLASIVIVVLIQFFLNKYISFREDKRTEEQVQPAFVTENIKNQIRKEKNKIYFVMPAYNEAENIEDTVKQWYPVVEKLFSGGVFLPS